jgi:hypothetical protein
MRWTAFATLYLAVQSLGAAVWWCVLLIRPDSRKAFTAAGSPDSVLTAFFIPDLLLFIALGAAAAYGLANRRKWAWTALCVHVGAAGYAALYCIALTVVTKGDAWLGAVLMAPPLVVPGFLAWKLRPKEAELS